ncbi:MAG: cytochrome c biogenesis CcdA family protein [Haliea sp.]
MSIDLASYPLAYLAGLLSIMSPCVWPLVPMVMSSAAVSGRFGPLYLALGLSLSFALAGSVLTFLLLNIGLGLEVLRDFAAIALILVALPLLSQRLGDKVSYQLSRLTSRFDTSTSVGISSGGQFAAGALVGFVWLPCIGPTLGAAVALASLGQDMVAAFVVMFIFGVGTTSGLVIVAMASTRLLRRVSPGVIQRAGNGKKLLGGVLLLMGVLVLTGWDKWLEAWALSWLPDWAVSI